MKAVFRYPIAEIDEQAIALPSGAQLLTIQRQTRIPMVMSLWALVDPDQPLVGRRIIWRGTGHEVPEGAIFINTYQEQNGYVWHFFDGGEEL